MISGKNNFACRNSYVDMRINNAVLQLILLPIVTIYMKKLLNSDWLRVLQFYWETVSPGNWFKFWQLKTCMKLLCHSNEWVNHLYLMSFMRTRDHNLFLHNLFMYIRNNNSVVSRGKFGKIYACKFIKGCCRSSSGLVQFWSSFTSFISN
jgi:hypothetical protein